MTRLIITFLPMFLLFTLAAEDRSPATDIGLSLGYNYSQHVGEDTDLGDIEVFPGSTDGFSASLLMRYPLSDRFFVLSEIAFISGGSDERITTTVGSWEIEFQSNYRVSYLSFPVQIGGRLFSIGKYDIELFAGPYMAFPIKADYEFHNGLLDTVVNSDITSYVSTDMGFSIGEGIYRDTKYGRIGIDLRYFWGFVYSGYPTYENWDEAPLKNLFMTFNIQWYPGIREE